MKRKTKSIRFKILIPATVVVVIICIVTGVTSYFGIKDGMIAMGGEEARMAATAACDVIDGDLIEKIVPGSEDSEEYRILLGAMRNIQQKYGIAYLYTLYTDEKTVYFGVDTDNTDKQEKVGADFTISYEELKGVFEGEKYSENRIDYTDNGALITVYSPILNSEGKVVGALGSDYDARHIVERLRQTVIRTVIITAACMVAAVCLLGLIVESIMKNLQTVDRKVREIVHSDGDLTQQISVHSNDELEVIADNVNTVLRNICAQARIAKEVAGGNLTVEVHPMSDKDILGNALKQMVRNNAHALRGIQEAAAYAKAGAEQIADASEALAKSATEQAAAVEEITESLNSVSERIRQNAEDAAKAVETVYAAMGTADNDSAQMQDVTAALNAVGSMSDDIARINDAVEQISETVQLNSAASEEFAATGLELSELMATVDELLSVYRIPDSEE